MQPQISPYPGKSAANPAPLHRHRRLKPPAETRTQQLISPLGSSCQKRSSTEGGAVYAGKAAHVVRLYRPPPPELDREPGISQAPSFHCNTGAVELNDPLLGGGGSKRFFSAA